MLDLPGIIEGAAYGRGRGRQVVACAKTADLILIVLDAAKEQMKNHKHILEKEHELITEELKNSGKPEDIAKKISSGKMNKFKEENSLMTQQWVMEPKKKVKDIIKELNSKDLKIVEFFRIKIGD